jgi:hypothetical protein
MSKKAKAKAKEAKKAGGGKVFATNVSKLVFKANNPLVREIVGDTLVDKAVQEVEQGALLVKTPNIKKVLTYHDVELVARTRLGKLFADRLLDGLRKRMEQEGIMGAELFRKKTYTGGGEG